METRDLLRFAGYFIGFCVLSFLWAVGTHLLGGNPSKLDVQHNVTLAVFVTTISAIRERRT